MSATAPPTNRPSRTRPSGGGAPPRVSVLVASHDYASYLGEALGSVLGQTFGDWECIVVDDGSSDASLAVAEGFAAADPRFSVHTHDDGRNHGLPETLRLALSLARGEFVAFLESDDVWEPSVLEARLAGIGTAGAVFNDVAPLVMPGASVVWFDGYVPRVMAAHARRTQPFDLRRAMLTECQIPTFSCAMARTALLRRCSLDAPVARWLDWWVWSQIARMTAFAFVPERLTRWRLHGGSLNRATTLARHLSDVRAMWSGFRGLDPSPVVRLPFVAQPMLRLLAMTRGSGPRGLLRRIRSRLS